MTVTTLQPVMQDHLMVFIYLKSWFLILKPEISRADLLTDVCHCETSSVDFWDDLFLWCCFIPEDRLGVTRPVSTTPTLIIVNERISPPELTYLPPLFTCAFRFGHRNACFHRKCKRKHHRAALDWLGAFTCFSVSLRPPSRLLDLQRITLMRRCHWKPTGNFSLASPPVKVYLVIQLFAAPQMKPVGPVLMFWQLNK